MLRQLGIPEGAPVLLGASTHKGEEASLGRALLSLRDAFPDLLFISVPRHAERAAEAKADLEALGLKVQLRSEMRAIQAEGLSSRASDRPDVLLVNTTGELRDWYDCATVVFVGKSLLTARGGQNPAEPIVAGRATTFGPHMQNFAILVHGLLRAEGAVSIADEAALPGAIEELLRDPEKRASLIRNGQSVVASHRGATDRTCDALRIGG
jgi:3-deoxy-D-manno-octulosonic-acid transferase